MSALDWRNMFRRYLEIVSHNEGVYFIDTHDWTTAEHAAIQTLISDIRTADTGAVTRQQSQ